MSGQALSPAIALPPGTPQARPDPLVQVGLLGLAVLVVGSSALLAANGQSPWPWLATGLVVMAMAALALLWPRVGVLVLLVLLYTRLSDLHVLDPLVPSANQVLTALFVGGATLRLVTRRGGLVWDRALTWMLVYGLAIGLSILGAANVRAAETGLLSYTRDLLIVLIMVHLVTTWSSLRLATWALIAGGVFLAVAAILRVETGSDLGGLASVEYAYTTAGGSGTLMAGAIHESNYFAQMLVPLAPLALYRAWGERRWVWRSLALASFALIVATTTLTFSRGGFLGLAVALGCAALMQRRRPKRLLLLALGLALSLLATPSEYAGRIGSIGSLGDSLWASIQPASDQPAATSGRTVVRDDWATSGTGSLAVLGSFLERALLLRVGLLMVGEHPLTGVGRDNWYPSYPRYYWRVSSALPSSPRGVHSTPLEIAAETGLLGLTAFVAAVGAAVLGARQAKHALARTGSDRHALLLEAVEVAIYGYLVTCLFLNDNYTRWLWLLVALAIVGRRLALDASAVAREQMPAVALGPGGAGRVSASGA